MVRLTLWGLGIAVCLLIAHTLFSPQAQGSDSIDWATSAPVPTSTPVSSVARYQAWQQGMRNVIGGVRAFYPALAEAARSPYQFESRLQGARDDINAALDDLNALHPPPGYEQLDGVMGESLTQYLQGVDDVDAGTVNNDVGQVKQGVRELNRGAFYLTIFRVMLDRKQPLLWREGPRPKPAGRTSVNAPSASA